MSGLLVSVDPGLCSGYALWNDAGKLIEAGLVEGKNSLEVARGFEEVLSGLGRFDLAIEVPQVYRGKGVDANSLIKLALTAGAIEHVVGASTRYLPREWKGQVPKPKKGETYVIETRCRKRLSVEEVACVAVPRSREKSWDLWDAVGIGLHHLGRW